MNKVECDKQKWVWREVRRLPGKPGQNHTTDKDPVGELSLLK